ncbi:MAG TPA: carboxylesterase/lipase family protein [Caulobacteraceae bacterium]|jgi:para-nitrobenzyl esterase
MSPQGSADGPNRRAVGLGLGAGFIVARSALAAAGSASPVVATSAGAIRGVSDGGVLAFKGVPYGADTGAARFQPPRPAPAWQGVRDTTSYGPTAPQTRPDGPTSEDCLCLNVWTPGGDAARRPVMVYIHGGAYAAGSGSAPLYDGVRLAKRRDVVVVTLNHRLNVFGYGYLATLGGAAFADSGNAGQLDLVLALRWVRANIARFGGDPGRVTLFGQSGGGAKIATLMAMPAATGLFHRAITMSGQQVTASGPLHAEARMRLFLDAVKIVPANAATLASLPTDRLVGALETPDPFTPGPLYFGPVLDERSLTRHPFWPDAPPQSATVPMMIGNCHDETRAFLAHTQPDPFTMTWDQLPARLAPEMRVDIDPAFVVAAYRRLYPGYSPTDVFFAATTAGRSWRGAVIEAEARARQGAPAFVYEMDYPTTIEGGRLKAMHTTDISLAFDNLAAPGSPIAPSADAQAMADKVSVTFAAFAHRGNPNNIAIPRWSPYTLPRRQTLVFDRETRLVDDPRGAERRLFAAVPYIQPGT